jgi:hypothetical protein
MASLSSAKPSWRPSSALPDDAAPRPRWTLSRRELREEGRRGVVGRLRGDLLRVRWRCEGGSPVAACQRGRGTGAGRNDGRVGVVDAIARGWCRCGVARGSLVLSSHHRKQYAHAYRAPCVSRDDGVRVSSPT